MDLYATSEPLTALLPVAETSSVTYPALNLSTDEGEADEGEADATNSVSVREQIQTGLKRLENLTNTLAEGSGDWTRSLPCNDIFCIQFSWVPQTDDTPVIGGDSNATAESYRPTDDCIACHLSFLSKRLQETVAGPLVPGKVSMNYFEDATCKQGGFLSELDFKVRAIPKPISLDPFDTMDEVPAEATQSFLDQLNRFGALPDASESSTSALNVSDSSTYQNSFADQECTAILHAAQLGDSPPTIASVQNACEDAFKRWDAAVSEAFRRFELEASVDNITGPYEQIVAELLALQSLFAALEDGLASTYTSEDAPLPALVAKPYCQ